MIKLSKRLELIAQYVSDDTSLVDVGCDHALLDIYLVQNRKNISVIASDINDKALKGAKKNIRTYHVDDKISIIQSNGLENVDCTGLDTVVISGMGAHTIVGILHCSLNKLRNISTLIIQSNNDLDFLRKRVTEIGYYIFDEAMVKDSGIIYTVVVFKRGHKFYSKKELFFGPILLKKNDKLFIEQCKYQLSKLLEFYPLIPKKRIHHRFVTYKKIRNLKKIIG